MKKLISPRLASQIQRRTKQHTYNDTGRIIYLETTSSDALGDPVITEREGGLLNCSFSWRKKNEKWTGTTDIKEWDATVRIDQNNYVTGNDKFKILNRYGTVQEESFTFEIVDIDNRAAFGYALALKQVTP